MIMPPLTFPEVLEKALIAWRTIQTKNHASVSINSFAKYLGYSRSMVSNWMNGDRPVTYDAFDKMMPKLHELIGPEVYKMREHPEPDFVLKHFVRSWDQLTEEQRMDLSGMLEDFLEENKVNPNGNSFLSKSVT
jgi:transcriptional regulator with XRE-family HTH domain